MAIVCESGQIHCRQRLGETAAVDGMLAVVGAPGILTDQANAGAVYAYAQQEGAWGESVKLL